MLNPQDVRLAVIWGGPSPEQGVSERSARGVYEALRAVYPHTQWLQWDADLIHHLQHHAVDVAIPIVHGVPGEDGALHALLDHLGIPAVGSPMSAHALAMDKWATKRVLQPLGIPMTRDWLVKQEDSSPWEACLDQDACQRFVLKPLTSGSSLGVTFASRDELADTMIKLLQAHDHLLVEPYVAGREITVAVLDFHTQQQAYTVEITTPPGTWYDFEHRYTAGLSEHLIPAPVTTAVTQTLEQSALLAHRMLGCRDFSRSDYIVTPDDTVYFLETNSIPGMTPTSLYPDALRHAGYTLLDLFDQWIALARDRGPSWQH